jgi:undecaprenyl-diphosphatase
VTGNLLSRALQYVRQYISKDTKLLMVMLAIVAGILVFVELFDEVAEGDTHAFDLFVMEAAGKHRGPEWLQQMGRDVTALGAGSVLGLATLAVVGFLILRRQFHAVWLVVASTVGGYLVSSLLKEAIGRERPAVFEHGDIVSSMSFPSGHAMMSAVVYLTLASLLMRLVKERHLKIYILLLASSLTFIIGVSRVYMGVHWPTDVLAGWTAGLVWASLCSLVARQLQRKGVVEKETEAAKN